MKASITWLIIAVLAQALATAQAGETANAEIDRLLAEFRNYSGAQLVFQAAELPAGEYYEIMPELSEDRRLAAAKIACREAHKYPPGYLAAMKFKAIGIFQACASQTNDGFHPYDKALGGYRYFGLYNGRDAVVAAYYSDSQLPLTMHHEIFHHVDRHTSATLDWNEVTAQPSRPAESRLDARPAGRYPALDVTGADRAMLERQCAGADCSTRS